MQEFLSFLASLGFSVPNVTLDGAIHRFDRNGHGNAWYIGWQNFAVKSGKQYIVAEVGDWKTGERHTFNPPNGETTKEDREAIKAQQAEASRRFVEEKRQRQLEAADKAEKMWSSAAEGFATPYMERKKVAAAYGTRTLAGQDGRVVLVPMRDVDGKLWGAQRIFSDGSKKFVWGQRVEGCFHWIADAAKKSDVLYIAEGFATAASIHEATRDPVAVAFNANNLQHVAKALKKQFPDTRFIIAGDDDRWTKVGDVENPGRHYAGKAALVSMGAAVFPEFKNLDGKPTDWNDLHCREGIETVRDQLGEDVPIESGFIPLGFEEGAHFFYVSDAKDLVKMTGMSEVQMFMLAPKQYWEEAYPSKIGVAWNDAKNDLIQRSKRVGPFDNFRVRGTGVWIDAGRVVINTGQSLIVDGRRVHMTALPSRFVYIQTKNRMPPIHERPATPEDLKPLMDACLLLKWRDPKAGYFLAGWLAIARIASALPVRPHVWLTGSSGSGKSTVMDRVIRTALGSDEGKLYLQGGSTEAGIRQKIRADCLPVIFDEFETTNEQNRERVTALVELLRQSWSSTQGCIVKGSANGIATQYALSFPALVSSIRVNLENDADRSRFTILELANHDNDLEHWRALKANLAHCTEELGERLFSRSSKMVKTIIASYENLSSALAGTTSQRFGQQYGMLLAGYYSLVSDDVCSPETAKAIVGELDFNEEVAEQIADEFECLNHLMTMKVRFSVSGQTAVELCIGEVICNRSGYREELKNYGVLVEEDGILIANEHAALRALYGKTRWVNWSKSLARLPGAIKADRKWFGKKQSRCVKIPLDLIG